MIKASLEPQIDNIYNIEYHENSSTTFEKILYASQKLEMEGNIEGACEARFEGCQQLMTLIPEDELIALDWEDSDSRGAMMLLSFSAIDHFLISDFEMAAAMFELLLDLDSEDHTDATTLLSYCYIALDEKELLEETIFDVSEKSPQRALLRLWADFKFEGEINKDALRSLKKFHEPVYQEFIADNHPADADFIADLEGERPSRKAKARELWLQTEHLWLAYPQFIKELRNS